MSMTRSIGSFVFLVLLALESSAWAGTGVGWPSSGRPAVTVPGDLFSIDAPGAVDGQLVSGTKRISVEITLNNGTLPEGGSVVHVPTTMEPGRYQLSVAMPGGARVERGPVFVLSSIPSEYRVAIVRADMGGEDEGVFSPDLLDEVASSSPDMVFVIGMLTQDGTSSSYAHTARQFAALPFPTFFCPDESELLRGPYVEHFGEPVHAFRFGGDGYLFLGSGPAHRDSGIAAQIGPIHRWRRLLRSSRWSIGVAGRFGLDWSVRSQLVLFVDDPLDYLVPGTVPAGVAERVPWGRTRLALPSGGPLQIIHVGDTEIVTPEPPAE
jgi:hypothetical protein